MYQYLKVLILIILFSACNAQTKPSTEKANQTKLKIVDYPAPGASLTEQYIPLLEGKKVGLVVNHTSYIGGMHLLDTLISSGIKVEKIFAPEHGFRGNEDAGAVIKNGVDQKSGLKVYSLYGKTKKPTPEFLADLDILVFDIQDVGCRFYTYISTLSYVMEACAENNIPLLILDRPNPNGFYIDGPVLNTALRSFVGLHEIPVVYGMSIGEYAEMLKGEGWINQSELLQLQVVYCPDYSRLSSFNLPIRPSPNLPNHRSVLLYPSLCLFEGTSISVGRGTLKPFQHVGHPKLNDYSYHFTPTSTQGAKYPKHENLFCYGIDYSTISFEELMNWNFNLDPLIEFHSSMINKNINFFNDNNFFEKLAGSDALRNQIKDGILKEKIEDSWQQDLENFKSIRSKYLYYEN